MPGVSTMLALYPEQDVAIVVLLNALDREQRVEIAREVASVVIPGYREARTARGESPRTLSDPEPDDPSARVGGRWMGSLKTWEGDIPAVLAVDPDEKGTVTLGDGEPLEIRSLSFRDDVLSGQIHGQIPTADARVHPRQIVILKLVFRKEGTGPEAEEVLEGQATAQTTDYPSHFALSSYLRLVRVRAPRPEPRRRSPSGGAEDG
jgi:hypothetical protein